MLGAIIGDIVGSVYEWNNIKTKDFPLFREDCRFTDDTVMTAAVAEAVMEGGTEEALIASMRKFGGMYPHAGYGGRFRDWLRAERPAPYGSWGNGSAMRVSPVGWVMDCGAYCETGRWPSEGQALARRSAAVTHDHPEGIKGAMAVADAIFICRLYREKHKAAGGGPILPTIEACKAMVREHIQLAYGYDLGRTLDQIRPVYDHFDVSCPGSVPEAIIAFLDSRDYEDAIRGAVSIGGDSDTIAAIAGSIAEAAYGIPQRIIDKALNYLDPPLREVCRRWRAWLAERGGGAAAGDAPVRELKLGRIYRHFKGDHYLAEALAADSETGESMVVYRKLYGDGGLWVRPLSMFLEEVDRKKYPHVTQKYRFELLDVDSTAKH